MFREKTEDAGISAEWLVADWGTVGVDMVEVLNYHAHQKDLIIVGQVEPEKHEGDVPSDLPERVVLGAGRPVLVVPFAGTFSTVGERVIVAWKAGRASARAVNDAMPLLLHSEGVFVVSITSPGDQAERRVECDICTHLERHNITVKSETVPTENPVANVLMNFAWDHGCDLIVTGAYAHSPRGTLYLGPVAKQLLNSMTVPVLMSH
jgi:nucleotide-binding universal stress UspA family protein